MAKIKGIVVDQSAPGNIRLAELDSPQPLPNEAIIRVAATSLNRGELRMAGMGQNGRRIGWDFAGVVEQAARNGSGPQEGARVVGMLPSGAWAERIAAPTDAFAVLPEQVSFAQAATLPVAGLTALYGLEKGSGLLGRRVLITGGSGGVGQFGIRLARLGGAYVAATARDADKADLLRKSGAHEVIVAEDPRAIAGPGPYDVILDGVGGPMLGELAAHLAKNGILIIYGATAGSDVTINARTFYATGGARIYGFILFHELLSVPAAVGLTYLGRLVADGRLQPLIDAEVPVEKLSEMAQNLMARKFNGKAVITF